MKAVNQLLAELRGDLAKYEQRERDSHFEENRFKNYGRADATRKAIEAIPQATGASEATRGEAAASLARGIVR